MKDLRDSHDVVCEQMPAKDAPTEEWAAHHRWAAEYYEQSGDHFNAVKARYRANLYERESP